MSKNTIARLYEQGRLDDAGMRKAVRLKWITPAEYEEITGNPYEA